MSPEREPPVSQSALPCDVKTVITTLLFSRLLRAPGRVTTCSGSPVVLTAGMFDRCSSGGAGADGQLELDRHLCRGPGEGPGALAPT